VNENGFTRPFALDAKSLKPLPLPPLPDADHVYWGPTTYNGRFTTLGIDDGRRPVQAYVFDWQSRKLEKWHGRRQDSSLDSPAGEMRERSVPGSR
jgi:hypothetical protein